MSESDIHVRILRLKSYFGGKCENSEIKFYILRLESGFWWKKWQNLVKIWGKILLTFFQWPSSSSVQHPNVSSQKGHILPLLLNPNSQMYESTRPPNGGIWRWNINLLEPSKRSSHLLISSCLCWCDGWTLLPVSVSCVWSQMGHLIHNAEPFPSCPWTLIPNPASGNWTSSWDDRRLRPGLQSQLPSRQKVLPPFCPRRLSYHLLLQSGSLWDSPCLCCSFQVCMVKITFLSWV